jgi:acyl transferase domain-containing protein
MACRLPGGIASPSELWDFLLAKGDARSEVPETRFNLSGYYQEPKNGHRKPGTTVTRHGYFLDSNIDIGALDTSFYPMARSEVEQLDPQVKLLLEVARECLDDAGAVDWRGGKVGAYVGSYGNDWYDVYNKDERKYGMYQIGTTHDFTLSNRLSYELDLRGPRYVCPHLLHQR